MLQGLVLPFLTRFGCRPSIHFVGIHMIFKEFANIQDWRVSSRSCTVTNKSKSLTYTVASSFVSTDPFAVMTVVGRIGRRSAAFKDSAESAHLFCQMPGFSAIPSLLCLSLLDSDPRILERRNCAYEDARVQYLPEMVHSFPEHS